MPLFLPSPSPPSSPDPNTPPTSDDEDDVSLVRSLYAQLTALITIHLSTRTHLTTLSQDAQTLEQMRPRIPGTGPIRDRYESIVERTGAYIAAVKGHDDRLEEAVALIADAIVGMLAEVMEQEEKGEEEGRMEGEGVLVTELEEEEEVDQVAALEEGEEDLWQLRYE